MSKKYMLLGQTGWRSYRVQTLSNQILMTLSKDGSDNPAFPIPRKPPGIILAGGESRRMAGIDKRTILYQGEPLLRRVWSRLRPQVSDLAIVLHDEDDPIRALLPEAAFLSDGQPERQGPLAGIAAGLAWAKAKGWSSHLAVVAGDLPFLPLDLVARLRDKIRPGENIPICAVGGGRLQPLAALWPLTVHDAVRQSLTDGERGVERFLAHVAFCVVDFDQRDTADPFLNINTPLDRQRIDLGHKSPAAKII